MCSIITRYRGWIRLLVFICGIVVLNSLLGFLLVPAGAFSRWVQHEAVTPENTYDLIAFGSSETLRTWDSPWADELLGIKSFNMGTSATYLDGGVYATFQDTMLHQNPSRVIFFLGRYEMISEVESPKSYIAIAPYLSSYRVAAEYYFRTIHMGGAMKRLFPWTEYHVDSWKDLKTNFTKKISKEYRQYDMSLIGSEEFPYRGQGFCPRPYIPKYIISYDNMDISKVSDGQFRNKDCTFLPQKVKLLKKMISYCKERDCEVVVLSAPIPITSIFSSNHYNSYSQQLKELVESEGAYYYDLNFAKKELWDPQLDDFYDESHVNERGAKKVTKSICTLLQKQDMGKDTSDLFYSTWEEYLESIDYVVATYMITEETDEIICVQAYCITGTKVIPEYKFVLINKENDCEEIIQDFDSENEISVSKERLLNESIFLRVYARVRGETDEKYIRYYDYQK